MDKIKVKKNKAILYASTTTTLEDHFAGHVAGKKLVKLTDNQSGYTVKFYSYSPTCPSYSVNLGYDDLDDLIKVALALFNSRPDVYTSKKIADELTKEAQRLGLYS